MAVGMAYVHVCIGEVKRLLSAHYWLQLRHGVAVVEGVERSQPRLGAMEKVTLRGLLRLVSVARVLLMEDYGGYKMVPLVSKGAQASLLAEWILICVRPA